MSTKLEELFGQTEEEEARAEFVRSIIECAVVEVSAHAGKKSAKVAETLFADYLSHLVNKDDVSINDLADVHLRKVPKHVRYAVADALMKVLLKWVVTAAELVEVGTALFDKIDRLNDAQEKAKKRRKK